MPLSLGLRVILLDAVGTLMFPDPPPAQVYYAAAAACRSKRSIDEIETRFRQVLRRHFHAQSQYAPISEATERERWRRIVADVIDDVADEDGALFTGLWQHFGQSTSWRLYDDVQPVWQELVDRGFQLGIASNFDGRLRPICQDLLRNVTPDRIFISSEIGFPKPAAQFFEIVQSRLGVRSEEILLVGDDLEADYLGATNSGWHGVWLRRNTVTQPNSAASISTLRELLK